MSEFSLGHVGINVTELARSIAFYREVFNLEVIAEESDGNRRFAFLGSDGAILVTLWQQSVGDFAPDRPGLHHMAFVVDDIETVHSVEARVRAVGAQLFHDGVVPHREGSSAGGIFFTDPDGTRLEIYTTSGADTASAPSGSAPTCGFF